MINYFPLSFPSLSDLLLAAARPRGNFDVEFNTGIMDSDPVGIPSGMGGEDSASADMVGAVIGISGHCSTW